MKEKYAQAKKTAQEVNNARKTIDQQKRLIEKIRKERALAEIVNEETGEGLREESIEELEAKKIIAREKQTYKESYEKLRELKAEIEQIQTLMERSRQKLQKDFDGWYETQGRGETLTKALVESKSNRLEFKPPLEIKQAWASPTTAASTGFRDTDDDIAAFYKANELLKARRAKKSNN